MNLRKVLYLNGNIKRIETFRAMGMPNPYIAASFQTQGMDIGTHQLEVLDECLEVLTAKVFPKKAMAKSVYYWKLAEQLTEQFNREAQEEGG